jgi:hypothetical protein
MCLKEKQLNYVPNVAAFIEGKSFIFLILFFSYYAHVPLNSGWHTIV